MSKVVTQENGRDMAVLYPYFSVDDLTVLFNMSRGSVSRIVKKYVPEQRTAAESKNLERVTALGSEEYQLAESVISRRDGAWPYTVEEVDETTVSQDMTDIFTQDLDTTIPDDLLMGIDEDSDLSPIEQRYVQLGGMIRQLSNYGVFSDYHHLTIRVKYDIGGGMNFSYESLGRMKEVLQKGFEGVPFTLALEIEYASHNSDDAQIETYLGELRQQGWTAGRLSTTELDRLIIRV